MRIGLYLGRHSGKGGGIAVYARSFLLNFVELMAERANDQLELVVYADSTILDEDTRRILSLSEVLVSEVGETSYRGASSYFRRLPNGARCRVLLRSLGSVFNRSVSTLSDQLVLPFLLRLDRIALLHSLANVGIQYPGCPQVITMHDLYQGWPELATGIPAASFWPSRLYRSIFRAQAEKAALVITDAAHVADDAVRLLGVNRRALRTVPLGLDEVFVDYLRDGTEAAQFVPDEHGLPETPPYILAFGSVDPRKNLYVTMQAWLTLPEEYQKFPLALIAPSNAVKRYAKQIAGKLDADRTLCLLPWIPREKLPSLYQQAGVILVSTFAEGFGFPAVEAHALQVPVVCCQIEALAGSGRSEGVFFCQPGSVDSVRQELIAALDYSANANRVERGLPLERMRTMRDATAETLALYNEIVLRYGTPKR